MPTVKTIKKDGTGDYTTLQAARDAAQTGWELHIYSGTYNEAVSAAAGQAGVIWKVPTGQKVIMDGLEKTLSTALKMKDGDKVVVDDYKGLEIRKYDNDVRGIIEPDAGTPRFDVEGVWIHDCLGRGITGMAGVDANNRALIQRNIVTDVTDIAIYGTSGDFVDVFVNHVDRAGAGFNWIDNNGASSRTKRNTIPGLVGTNSRGIRGANEVDGNIIVVDPTGAAPEYGIAGITGVKNIVNGTFSGLSFENPGDGTNLTSDPLFADGATHPRPTSTSPAIDGGVTTTGVTKDVRGNPITTGAAADRGAYEYQPFRVVRLAPIGRRTILVTVTRAARTVGDGDAKDALRGANWTLTDSDGKKIRVISGEAVTGDPANSFRLTCVRELDHRLSYTLLAVGVRDADEAFVFENPSNAVGGLIISPREALQRADTQNGLRDFRNSPFPASPPSILKVTQEGDYDISEGIETLQKLIIRRLITRPGEFYHLPNYGVDLKVKDLYSGQTLIALQRKVEEEVKKEPEVTGCKARLTLEPEGALKIELLLKLAGGLEDVVKLPALKTAGGGFGIA